MDTALIEAEERLAFLERGLGVIEQVDRERVVVLYANFIRSWEGCAVDKSTMVEKQHQFFKEYSEFRLEVSKIIGKTKMEELFGTEAEFETLHQSQQHALSLDLQSREEHLSKK
jgi:hypothetical protein